jgi:VIT1/CCC1 family predicted Fe2+/Mn2+ transporter
MYNGGYMELHERSEELKRHIAREHRQTPVATYLKEVIYGGVDGIITTFAVVAGFSGAALSNETTTQLSFLVVLLFGLANLLADGVSMGLGNFLSVRSDQSLYCKIRADEKREMQSNPDIELKETVTILMQKGFSEEDASTLASIYQKNESYWLDFMMNHELEIPDPTDDNPTRTGLATFLSFIVFGFIPLVPFILFATLPPHVVFQFSSAFALAALVLLGILKWRIVGTKPLKSIFEVVLVGGVAACVAFFVGSFFNI